MKDTVKIWLSALAMGILLPGLFFSVAEKMAVKKPAENAVTEEQLPQQTEQLPQQNDPQAEGVESVTVLLKNGMLTQMDANTYLTGVLLREMPADFHDEALKAQAVVARTYACKRNTGAAKHTANAVCTDASCCQGYWDIADYLEQGGSQVTVDRVAAAVQATEKQVLTYHGTLIEATYFSCSGGRTEDALAVWGTDIPYLQAVDSPGEEGASYHTDTVKFSSQEFAARLGISPAGLPATWFGQVTYTKGGGVDTMVIAGIVYGGTTLREKLGLRSTAFTVLAVGDSIHVTTKGYGHRVGMSQYGAEAMAVSGSSYREIVAHYYPETCLDIWQEN